MRLLIDRSIVFILSLLLFTSFAVALNPTSVPVSDLKSSLLAPESTVSQDKPPARLIEAGQEGMRELNKRRRIGNERIRYEIVRKKVQGRPDVPSVSLYNRDQRQSETMEVPQVENELVKLLTVSSPEVATVPGRNLSVRPIGLIVLGSLFAFAFLVIGFGTYEKYQYRKLYRTRLEQQRQRDQLAIDPFRG